MAFQCPHCAHTMHVKTPKPGRFTPKCPKCTQSFVLTIPEDTSAEWKVTLLPATKTVVGGSPATTNPAPVDSTGAFEGLPPPPPTATKTVIGQGKVTPSPVEATGAFEALPPPPPPAGKTIIGQGKAKSSPPAEATGAFDGIGSTTDQTIGDAGAVVQPSFDQTMAEGEVKEPSVGQIKTKLPKGKASRTIAEQGRDETIGGDPPPKKSAGVDPDLPDVMGGYQLVKELGRGGMGAVYLARQISLDRNVALKVMNARWAEDPIFVARFAREAYAAAQLVHHNVVQIYDIGEQDGVNYFSMEFVEGQSLADLVRKDGKLDPELAVGFILQAARGLKFAHDRGMIHRDIKPDNLMLNNQGIVKVADLGLVKTPDMTQLDDQISVQNNDEDRPATASRTGLASLPSNVTNVNVAMGTPAYMSPEQCRDAANVDARADIYSLGCTLYVLLTGRPPFQGTTAFEVMSKHATEQLVPPDEIVKRVPKKVSDVLVKMMAKEADARQPDMGTLIKDLETWFGVNSAGPFTPREEHVEELETSVRHFNDHPKAKLKTRLIQGFFGLVGISLIGCLLFGAAPIAGGMLGLLLSTIGSYFVFNGLTEKGYFFRRTRETIFGASLGDWATGIVGGLIFVLILYLTGQIWYWLPFGVLGVGLGFGLCTIVDRKLVADRQKISDDLDGMFKRMRVQGLEEDALRLFVGKYSGRSWEALYEFLFGYENKIAMRGLMQRGDGGKAIEKHAAWRDPLIGYYDGIQTKRREARERKHIQKIEQKMLEAKGMDKAAAREQAEAVAEVLVQQAGELKAANDNATMMASESVGEVSKPVRVNVKSMLKAVDKPAKKLPKPPRKPVESAVKLLLSAKLRFLLAAALLAGGFLWAKQNINVEVAMISAFNAKLKEAKQPLIAVPQLPMAILDMSHLWPKSLDLGVIDAGSLFSHSNPLVAGVILLVSLFFVSVFGRVVISLGALVAFAGHLLFVPSVVSVPAYQVAILAGVAIGIVGMALSPPKKV